MKLIQPLVFLCATLLLPAMSLAASEAMTVSIDPQKPEGAISPETLGLSYETSRLLPDEKGVHYFRPDNQPLLEMFKTLGIKNLRIGGNSVDDPKIPIPTESDVSSLFDFAKAAGVKVIYSVRFQNGDPKSAARFARQIRDQYSDILDCFAIGNEPDYYKDYTVLESKWKTIQTAMLKEYPDARFCGLDQNPNPNLIKNAVRDFTPTGHFTMVTQHSYPFGCSYKNPHEGRLDVTKFIPYESLASCERMLSPDAYAIYAKIQKGMVDAVAGTPLSFRLTETNSYWFSGLKGASDRYAAAIWGLDYLHWWATHGAKGLNFHTGDQTGGKVALSCRYAVFVSSSKGYEAKPLAYGMKLFDLGGHGSQIPVTIKSTTENNIVAYAYLTDHKIISVTLINKTYNVGAKEMQITLKLASPTKISNAQAIYLRSTQADPTAESGITIGGEPIQQNGSWKGQWTPVELSSNTTSDLSVTLPPLSATVIEVHLQ